MPVRANLLSNFPGFATRDIEQARGHMSRLFGATRFEADPRGVDHAGVSANVLRLRETSLIWAQYDGKLSLGFSEGSFVRQYFTIGGKGRFSAGLQSGEITVHCPSPVIPPFTAVDMEMEQHNAVILRLAYKARTSYLSVLLAAALNKGPVVHHNAANSARTRLRRSTVLFV